MDTKTCTKEQREEPWGEDSHVAEASDVELVSAEGAGQAASQGGQLSRHVPLPTPPQPRMDLQLLPSTD